MKTKFTPKIKNRITTAIFIGIFCFLIGLSQTVFSQNCPVPDTKSVGWLRFPSGITTVKYYLSGNFNGQKQQVRDAFEKWTDATVGNPLNPLKPGTCFKVKFIEGAEDDYEYLVTDSIDEPTRTGYEENPYPNPITSATTNIKMDEFNSTLPSYSTVILKAALHEIGHTMGIDHPNNPRTPQASVMNSRRNNDDTDPAPNGMVPTDIANCDTLSVNQNPQCPSTPTPTPTPEDDPPTCNRWEMLDCPPDIGFWQDYPICACLYSPILLDVEGNGFTLTNAQNGVQFDINGDGRKEQIAWTTPNSDDAWLVLDRNGNGMIDDGRELFGSVTLQPPTPAGVMKNGFLALGEFDKPANGGNPDGGIDNRDSVFNQLRLWQDLNHNGVSEANELKPLLSLDVTAIEVDYKESKRTDEFGNRFRFRAKVWDSRNAKVGRWAWDVFLTR